MNPDSDFVLSGKTASYSCRDRCRYLTDSQQTISTGERIQRDEVDAGTQDVDEELRDLRQTAENLNRLSSRIVETLTDVRTSPNVRVHSAMAKHPVLGYNTSKYPQIQWLTEPVHVSHYSETVSTDLPRKFSNTRPIIERHFPLTLGSLETTIDYSAENYSDQHLGQFVFDKRVHDPKDSIRLELVTPFQVELARLRMQRLQLEEERLLEMKRLEELERIRGPRPKWYELRTPDFHYELHKNNELVRSETQWQELLNYRSDLLRAHDLNRKLNLSF